MKLFKVGFAKPSKEPEINIGELEEYDMESAIRADVTLNLSTDPHLSEEVAHREEQLLAHLQAEHDRIVDEIDYRTRILNSLNLAISASRHKLAVLKDPEFGSVTPLNTRPSELGYDVDKTLSDAATSNPIMPAAAAFEFSSAGD